MLRPAGTGAFDDPAAAESIDWATLVSLVLHPMKVAIIEALHWVDQPMSAIDIDRMWDEQKGVPVVAYHLRSLAGELQLLDLYAEEEVRYRWTRKLYFFRGRVPDCGCETDPA